MEFVATWESDQKLLRFLRLSVTKLLGHSERKNSREVIWSAHGQPKDQEQAKAFQRENTWDI